ncbi:hypothetical protein JW835_09180 [bacterium]|nr:hypothetical protein [bacterium]
MKCIAVSGTDLFAGTTGGGIFLSTDNGSHWNPVNSGITNLNIWSIFACGNQVFAGTEDGAYHSADHGISWNAVNEGFPHVTVYNLSCSDTRLFAGTSCELWTCDLSDIIVSVGDVNGISPGCVCLKQNYPNPFNAVTIIRFNMRKSARVKLAIMDMLGCELAVLLNDDRAAGSYSAVFHADHIPSSLYVCDLKAGNVRIRKKMLLLK